MNIKLIRNGISLYSIIVLTELSSIKNNDILQRTPTHTAVLPRAPCKVIVVKSCRRNDVKVKCYRPVMVTCGGVEWRSEDC